MRERIWVAGTSVALAAVLFVACGGSDKKSSPATSPSTRATTTTAPEDMDVTAAQFPNIHTLTPVDDHFVGNFLGHLDEALAVARSPQGGDYPVGTLIQLLPQEAMVKRAKGFNPATRDWEFFSLAVSAQGTKILTRGRDVVNRFGGNCASCHGLADAKFDMVCGHDHGCAPLPPPLTPEVVKAIQAADPRPTS